MSLSFRKTALVARRVRRNAVQIAVGQQSLRQRSKRNRPHALLAQHVEKALFGVRTNIEYLG